MYIKQFSLHKAFQKGDEKSELELVQWISSHITREVEV